MPDSRLQPPILRFSVTPIYGKCICDVCQLTSWLALWQDDLFKSTFYLFHFVWFVCVWLCLCVRALERTWDFKGLRRKRASAALLATRAGDYSQAEQLSFSECSPHFLLNSISIHWDADRMTWPHSASFDPFDLNVLSSTAVTHMCNRQTKTQIVWLKHSLWLVRNNAWIRPD